MSVPTLIPVPALDASVARLTQALTDLTTSHASNTTALSSLTAERHALDEKEKEMRSMVERAETKRSWFAAFRDWVESVATFLDDKVRSNCGALVSISNHMDLVVSCA